MKAVFLKDLDGFTGHASLYKLDEEVGYGRDWNELKFAGYTRYVIVSATDVMPSGPETYIFPADENGNILCWQELPGSYQGGLDHAEALRRIGATIWYAPEEGGLTFDALRAANMARLPAFRDRHGEPAHKEPDGSDWSPAQWLQAIIGELGEYANIRKKFERGDLTLEEFRAAAADELADVQCYLDILAWQLDIDLGRATMEKWNRVSERIGCDIRLGPNGWYRAHASTQALPTQNKPPRTEN